MRSRLSPGEIRGPRERALEGCGIRERNFVQVTHTVNGVWVSVIPIPRFLQTAQPHGSSATSAVFVNSCIPLAPIPSMLFSEREPMREVSRLDPPGGGKGELENVWLRGKRVEDGEFASEWHT